MQDTPNGESWEFYTVLADSQTFYGEENGTACWWRWDRGVVRGDGFSWSLVVGGQ